WRHSTRIARSSDHVQYFLRPCEADALESPADHPGIVKLDSPDFVRPFGEFPQDGLQVIVGDDEGGTLDLDGTSQSDDGWSTDITVGEGRLNDAACTGEVRQVNGFVLKDLAIR